MQKEAPGTFINDPLKYATIMQGIELASAFHSRADMHKVK